ncbi:MAG: hypothetical protein ACREA8_06680 [Nitrosotalea sp.]
MIRALCILAVLVATILAANIVPVLAGGEEVPCGFHLVLGKYTFTSEEKIPIKVTDPCNQSNGKMLVVTVTDANNSDKKFLDQRLTFEGSAEIDFVPMPDTYSYMVSVSDENGNFADKAAFFTKEGISDIAFGNVTIPDKVQAGASFDMQTRITDGLGNQVEGMPVYAVITVPDCARAISPNDLFSYLKYSGSSLEGSMDIPYWMPSGSYPVKIVTDDLPGYSHANTTAIIQIENNAPMQISRFFYNVQEGAAGFNSPLGFAPGQDIVITGRAQSDNCIPLVGVNVTGQLVSMPSPIIRGKSVSDADGNFKISLQTYPQMDSFRSYIVQLRAEYGNKSYNWQDPHQFMMRNILGYAFYADGKNSTAQIQADQGTSVTSLTFDKDSKRLTMIGTNNPNNQGQFTIIIPSELVSGDLFVHTGDNATLSVGGKDNWSDTYGPVLGPDDPRHAYGLEVSKNDGYSKVFYYTLTPGQKEIQVLGTTALPEFPFAQIVLVVSVVSSIIFYKMKFRK